MIGKHADPNIEEENHNEGARDQNPGENDVGCLKRDGEMKGKANKVADLQSVVNFMMQNNVMQPPYPLQDTPITAAKTDAQKGGQKEIPVGPQHDKEKECSHRSSQDVGRAESVRGESQRTTSY